MKHELQQRVRRLVRARRGSVLVIVAVASMVMLGVAAFAVDLGGAYVARGNAQRVADLAAYAGAIAYGNTGTTSSMTTTAARIATLNGFSSTAISTSLVTSPSGDGNNAVEASVTSSSPTYLAGVIGQGSTVAVGASSYAEIKAGTSGCITALQTSGSGISVTGGTSIAASGCAVASNGTVPGQNSSIYTTCGTTVTTPAVDYASAAAPVQSSCTAIKPPSGTSSVTFTHATSQDKLAANPEVVAATSRISTAAAVSSPAAPSLSGGTAVSFGYSPTTMTSPALPSGCTASLSGSTWTLSCSAAGTYTFGTISMSGGITVNFNTATRASQTININGDINGASGTAINFGAATYNISGGIVGAGSMAIAFDRNGIYNIGTTTSCKGGR